MSAITGPDNNARLKITLASGVFFIMITNLLVVCLTKPFYATIRVQTTAEWSFSHLIYNVFAEKESV